ncbi:Ion channel [Rhizobium leguminosarum bv. trifolii]|uniref:Ion channel n=2 Tax=Rhizobium leguminosarum TaxID=384 RepID=A0A3E1BZ15_RHILT|nr:Ion channel [Rhizobium leguminosarum bv. trifolii]RFC00807.1 Ion channel [Rhizobium leguminosarum bv. trifolii]
MTSGVPKPEPSGGDPQTQKMRRLFFIALARQLRVIWPILSGIVSIMVASGLAIWRIEDWRIDEALYFTFVTGLTIGYGDFTPKHVSARILALLIGFAGIVLTGVIAAITVKALNATDRDGGS